MENSMRDIIIKTVNVTSSLTNKINEMETKANSAILTNDLILDIYEEITKLLNLINNSGSNSGSNSDNLDLITIIFLNDFPDDLHVYYFQIINDSPTNSTMIDNCKQNSKISINLESQLCLCAYKDIATGQIPYYGKIYDKNMNQLGTIGNSTFSYTKDPSNDILYIEYAPYYGAL